MLKPGTVDGYGLIFLTKAPVEHLLWWHRPFKMPFSHKKGLKGFPKKWDKHKKNCSRYITH